MMVSTFSMGVDRILQGRAELGRAPVRVVRVDERQALARHHVARVHRPGAPEDDPGIPVRVAPPEVSYRSIWSGPLNSDVLFSNVIFGR